MAPATTASATGCGNVAAAAAATPRLRRTEPNPSILRRGKNRWCCGGGPAGSGGIDDAPCARVEGAAADVGESETGSGGARVEVTLAAASNSAVRRGSTCGTGSRDRYGDRSPPAPLPIRELDAMRGSSGESSSDAKTAAKSGDGTAAGGGEGNAAGARGSGRNAARMSSVSESAPSRSNGRSAAAAAAGGGWRTPASFSSPSSSQSRCASQARSDAGRSEGSTAAVASSFWATAAAGTVAATPASASAVKEFATPSLRRSTMSDSDAPAA